jgi:hypothetical protein
MGVIVRLAMAAGAALAGLVVARGAPNYSVVQGMVGLVVIAALVGVLALLQRK